MPTSFWRAGSGCNRGTSAHGPHDPIGRMFFNILATCAEFEADLIRLPIRGWLKGKPPKLSERQQKKLRRMHDSGGHGIGDLAELFSVSRPTGAALRRRKEGHGL